MRQGPLWLTLLAACAPAPGAVAPAAPPPVVAPVVSVAEQEAPSLRLPSDTHPLAETLVLKIDPREDRFSGVVDMTVSLDQPRSVLFLHGRDLHVTKATITPDGKPEASAVWKERDTHGTASLTVAAPIPPGQARIHVEYDAAFGSHLAGLFKLTQGGVPYAFTQFENIDARGAFPCFDEPGFKIPWDTTLIVPRDVVAIANTREIARVVDGASARVHFAPTRPLPSYLVAFAVGPLDVVTAPDIPPNAVRTRPLGLRGVATHGHGPELAYALAHTGEILTKLEQYFGSEYPFDKLDIIAVPDMNGAMENAGAVTFSDSLLLFDEKTASLRQRRGYAADMTHELAHQWVGNLVTAAWWDDIWLNEALATFIEAKISDAWDPRMEATTELVLGMQGAMGSDALVSARSIRQPIESTDDIENAFDGLTYQKGGATLRMFEHWVGEETFQRGLREYLRSRRWGSATADDLLGVISKVAGKDVKTPFRTFLDEPGVPFVEASVVCEGPPRLHLRQTRYLPMGSSGDTAKTWQVPVCARYGTRAGVKEACTLLVGQEGDLPLDECPAWVFPNADALGYFRFSLAPADLARLRTKGYASLNVHERLALGDSLRSAFARGTLPMKDAILASMPLARDAQPDVATIPMGLLHEAAGWLVDDPGHARVEAFSRQLFDGEYRALGWVRGKSDDGDKARLRERVIGFLATTGMDPVVRAEAKRRGLAYLGWKGDGKIHPDAVDRDLASVALQVTGQDADRPIWELLRSKLDATDEPGLRQALLDALTAARRPELEREVRELSLDPKLKATEMLLPLYRQLDRPETRAATWEWIKEHWDKLLAAVPADSQSQLVYMAGFLCDDAHAKDVAGFFTTERLSKVDGGPRVLAGAIESVRLCTIRREAALPSLRAMFSAKVP